MKTTLFLNDEKVQARLPLRNPAPAKAHEPEAIAGCNCDRWGHPCPDCVQRNVQPDVELLISMRAKQTE